MISIADVRARIETDLDDATLQRMIDSAVEEIEQRHGPAGPVTEVLLAGGTNVIVLSRQPAEVVEIRERRNADSSLVALSDNDYRQRSSMVLLRLADGDHPAGTWGAEVEVEYVPVVNAQLRDRITLDLVQMDVEFRAFGSERSGDWSGDQQDYGRRREALLAQLREPARGIL